MRQTLRSIGSTRGSLGTHCRSQRLTAGRPTTKTSLQLPNLQKREGGHLIRDLEGSVPRGIGPENSFVGDEATSRVNWAALAKAFMNLGTKRHLEQP